MNFEGVNSFFTPKLTNEGLKFVQEGNEEQLKTFQNNFFGLNPDADVKDRIRSQNMLMENVCD